MILSGSKCTRCVASVMRWRGIGDGVLSRAMVGGGDVSADARVIAVSQGCLVGRSNGTGRGAMATTVRATQAALVKARQRRLAIDAERDERDRRVEQTAADGLVLLADRAELVSSWSKSRQQWAAR